MKFIATCATVLLAALIMLIVRVPAHAALTAALTATTPTFTGTCPTTEAFTGTISGPAGTAFQYSFNRYINGVQQIQNVGAATLPASGTMTVSDSFSIASTSTGVNFDQIWVHNIAGGQPDVYSNRAAFSVTCGGGATSPPGGLGKYGKAGLQVDPNDAAGNPAAPFDISTSGDPKVCAAHIPNPLVAGLICPGIAAGKKLFIVWSWVPSGRCLSCPHDVDGFKIYRTDAAKSTRSYITETSAGADTTVSIVEAPGGNFVGKCFSVTAYKGAKESTLGAPTCLGSQPSVGTKISNLLPAHVRSSNKTHVQGTGIITSIGVNGHQLDPYNDMAAGYLYRTDVATFGDRYFDTIIRGAAMFDLSSLMGKPIMQATLILHANTDSKNGTKSCATELGTGKNEWWTNNDWLEADWFQLLPTNSTLLHVDVTNEVRSWLNGAPNFGFVIKQPNENLTIFAEDRCISGYDATLTIEHF